MDEAFKRNLKFLTKEQIDYVVKIMLGAIAYSLFFGFLQGENILEHLMGFTALFSVIGIMGMVLLFYNGYMGLALSFGSNRNSLVKAMYVSNVIAILFVIGVVSLLSLVAAPDMEMRGWIMTYYGIGCFFVMAWSMYGGIIWDKAKGKGLFIYGLVSVAIPVIFLIWLMLSGGNDTSVEVVSATAGVESDVFSLPWVGASIILVLILYIPAAWLTGKVVKKYEIQA